MRAFLAPSLQSITLINLAQRSMFEVVLRLPITYAAPVFLHRVIADVPPSRRSTSFVLPWPFFTYITVKLILFIPQLGSSEMNEAVMDVVTGHGDRVKDQFHSDIREYAAKIRWDGEKI